MLALLVVTHPADAHSWFSDKVSPTGAKCCNNDCVRVPVKIDEGTGAVEVFLNGRWWPAEDKHWWLGDSPDGSFYGCQMPSDPFPRCVWGGSGT